MERDPDPRRQDRLALIELFERDGRVGRSVSVHRWPLSLGRALDNDVVLDDPFIAAHHARLQPGADGALTLTVLDTVNGVALGRAQHAAGSEVVLPAAGAALQIGALKLRLRLPAETLAPERVLPERARAGLVGSFTASLQTALVAGGLMMALALFEHWISIDPGADAAAWLPVVVGIPLALAAWCGAWALVSKLFQHRFDFLGHLRIVLPWLLAAGLVNAVLPPLAAALAWPGLWRLGMPLQALLGLLLLREHLTHVLPLAHRTVTVALAAAALVGSAISLSLTLRATDRYSRAAYMSTLPLPSLQARGPMPSQQLVQELAPLAEQLAKRVKRARDEDAADGEAASE